VLACVVSADTKFEVQTAVRMCDNHNTQWYCNSFAIGTLWYIVYYSLSCTLHIYCCSQTCTKLQPYNDKSDIWAVGVILYQCCMSGHHPFEAKNQCALILKIIKGKYDPIPEDRVCTLYCIQYVLKCCICTSVWFALHSVCCTLLAKVHVLHDVRSMLPCLHFVLAHSISW
jgi:serine/threonine protein kinase